MMSLFSMCVPTWRSPMQSLVIVVEEGHAILELVRPIIYWGAYEGAHGTLLSWIKDGDMVYNHHRYLMGPMLLLLHDGGTHVVEISVE